MPLFYLGTESGFFSVDSEVDGLEDGVSPVNTGLNRMNVRMIAVNPDNFEEVYVGTYGNGLFKSKDAGESWKRVGEEVLDGYVRSILLSPSDSETVYVGTEPANLYKTKDGGKTWSDLDIRKLPGSTEWYLPYSPRAGAVRVLSIHESEPEVIYGGVEQGGLIKSEDGGNSWSIEDEKIHPDVHGMTIDPDDSSHILVATGGGVFLTDDDGESWKRVIEDYTRDVIFRRNKADFAFSGPAKAIGRSGRIELSKDGGRTWDEESEGLSTPMDDMVVYFVHDKELPEKMFSVTSGGRVIYSDLNSIKWKKGFQLGKHINSLAVAKC